MGNPPKSWFILENPKITMDDDSGYHIFRQTSPCEWRLYHQQWGFQTMNDTSDR